MSLSNCILKTLNLKEDNIIFDETFVNESIINGKKALIYNAWLSYIPLSCPHCGSVKDNKIIKHGFKLSKVKLPKVSNLDTYLFLNKQRYICRHCNKTFFCSSNVVNPNCYISNNTKLSIALEASKKKSECDIASENNVSHSTVNRIINSYYDSKTIYKNYLPENLSFDEFKSVKSANGAMSFIFCDASSGEVIDIVEDRKLNNLMKYFLFYDRKSRYSVKHIVIDMYMPYISLIKALFPNAKIITDRFHTTQLISRALNKTRITIMNKDNKNYNKYKRYWRLLLKPHEKLDNSRWLKWTCFNNLMTEMDVVNYLINQHIELKETHTLYQTLLYAFKTKDVRLFNNTINTEHNNISTYMMTSIKTLKEHQNYIINSLEVSYNNGRIEGINNLIKTIKRIAFGYRSFYHFKARIMIILNLVKLKKA